MAAETKLTDAQAQLASEIPDFHPTFPQSIGEEVMHTNPIEAKAFVQRWNSMCAHTMKTGKRKGQQCGDPTIGYWVQKHGVPALRAVTCRKHHFDNTTATAYQELQNECQKAFEQLAAPVIASRKRTRAAALLPYLRNNMEKMQKLLDSVEESRSPLDRFRDAMRREFGLGNDEVDARSKVAQVVRSAII